MTTVPTRGSADGAELRARHRRRRRLWLPHPRDVLVWLLGAVGLVSIAWLLASWLLGLHLVVLTTGSMSPGMPPGTAAVERTVAAAELRVGDVVSVPRAGDGEVVTHRIVEISSNGEPDQRTLTLQGDANDGPDTQPYTVSRAGLVVVAVPAVGYVVTFLGSPAGITLLAVLIPAGVLWVLWPRPART
ncbi:signal peptidase I [Microbacterium marinilacus]|uniref:Signal peptidase I n=1 Tax=Microbacterium marinilacus TaxID=415209 RepID=A0ABP7BBJ9_9MICO|nr:signal peptidase I [Microbacterium marinilacus]MBY0687051.1 signal peptidase I [Microbacterium marinilacus]